MKVTLLGDSIRQQYGPAVKEMLSDIAQVWAPQENCRFAQYTLRGLFDWAKNMDGSEIVHWNNGHWDVCRLFGDGTFTDEDTYVKNMMRILDILEKKNCKVIFATTTPVRDTNLYNKNEDIDCFNIRITSLLRERGVMINDLNLLLRGDVERYISEDAIHLTEEGIALCAEQVAASIREAAGMISAAPENKGEKSESVDAHLGAPILL